MMLNNTTSPTGTKLWFYTKQSTGSQFIQHYSDNVGLICIAIRVLHYSSTVSFSTNLDVSTAPTFRCTGCHLFFSVMTSLTVRCYVIPITHSRQ